ncbi:MAG TPA: amidohydrolase [Patescibacteria group bacterium]|nr:amidohydrolase [Patescibacteria group bacterium]
MNFDFSYADYAFVNGKVITVNENDDFAEAVAVKGNKIVYVGDKSGLEKIVDGKTKIIDLKGRSLTPGFIDCHFHPILYGFFDGAIIDITYARAKSIVEIQQIIKAEVAKKKKGEWIKLWGYDQNKIAEKRHVTIDDLDAVAPDNPVQCMRACGHMGIYNTLALAAGGINGPEDAGKFAANEVVVENGKLTGMTKETTNFFLWSKVVYTDEEMWTALKKSNDLLLKAGVTSIHDPGEFDAQSFGIMQTACRDWEFKPRVYAMLHSVFGKAYSMKDCDHFLGLGLHSGLGDEKFKLGTLKIMIDGGTSGPSCATREPYSHDANLPGIRTWEPEAVDAMIERVNAADCQMTAHAVGDLAVEMMIHGYEKALVKHPRADHRHRIEHCGITDEDLIRRMAAMNIIPVSNPAFMTINGSDYHRYYGERVDYMFAARSYLDAGLRPVIGSDAPTCDESVMRGLDGMVNRIDRKTGEVVGAKQKISMREALRLYTINGAYASYEDNIKGSIEVGKLADLVILSEDIMNYPPEKVMNIQVDMTMIDGAVVYERQ